MEEKKWSEISADELANRELLQETWKIEPTKKAVQRLDEAISKVLKTLGVETDKDAETIKRQMQLLEIHLNSINEEQMPNAAGIYISAIHKGAFQPYAYISCAKTNRKEYKFEVVYWDKNVMEEIVGTIQ